MPTTVAINASETGSDLRIRRHGLSQGGIDDAPFSPAVIERVRSLGPETLRFFVQEYFAMMPAVDRYDWSRIDAQLRSIAATGAKPILALTMKPPCLFPRIDHTLTTPSNWGAWERFIEAMARHFSRDLGLTGLWYEVGNEPDLGEPGGCPYLFEPGDYAEYYDRTARAALRGDPSAKVGGPALALIFDRKDFARTFAEGALRRNSPLDFFSWHNYNPAAEESQKKNAECVRFVRSLGGPFASAVTVLDEWNISWVCNNQFGEFAQASFAIDWVARMLDTGLDISNYYHAWDMPLIEEKWRGWFSPEGLARLKPFWISDYRGLHMLSMAGEPAASYAAFRMLYRLEGRRIPVERPSRHLGVLAARGEGGVRVLLWNYHHEELRREAVRLRVAGLPKKAATVRHYRLGGGTLRDLDGILCIRRGEFRLLAEEPASGGEIVRDVDVEPCSIHLIEVVSPAAPDTI